MFTVIKPILLCAVCTLAVASYFDWNQFEAIAGDKETKIVFDIKLETLRWRHGRSLMYPRGYYTVKQELKQSVKTDYQLKSEAGYIDETHSICNRSFHQKYLQPFGINSNYSSGYVCPITPHTLYFEEIDFCSELTASSDLPGGTYNIKVTFIENNYAIGGFFGRFHVHVLY